VGWRQGLTRVRWVPPSGIGPPASATTIQVPLFTYLFDQDSLGRYISRGRLFNRRAPDRSAWTT
jgi:hypothetical protein